MKIYLDDLRPIPDDSWTLLQTASEVIAALQSFKQEITELSLDHDLGFEHYAGNLTIEEAGYSGTGYDIVLWMERQVFELGNFECVPKIIRVHSANPVGKAKMLQGIYKIQEFLKDKR